MKSSEPRTYAGRPQKVPGGFQAVAYIRGFPFVSATKQTAAEAQAWATARVANAKPKVQK